MSRQFVVVTRLIKALRHFVAGAALGAGALAGVAQDVGQVTFVQGVTTAQSAGGEQRFIARGDTIRQGEVVTTGERGYAVLGLNDGTKLTLRSNTTFAVKELEQQAGKESLVMSLLRGGLRALTGSISKLRSQSARLSTPTATIGIRGTEFDARLCGADCRREAEFAKPVTVPPGQLPPVARVVIVHGTAFAVNAAGARRALVPGAAVFDNESVQTGADSHAVLAFRDRTKVTLIAQTDFKLENVRMAGAPEEGSFVVRLLAGGMRAVSGLIGKAKQSNVRFNTPTATIGIRGTGIDLQLRSGALYLYTWDGAAAIAPNSGGELVVDKDRAGVLDARSTGPELLAAVPQFFLDEAAVRPDRVEVDFDALFFVRRLDEVIPGLYVGVRRDNVSVTGPTGKFVDVGQFEAALVADGSDQPVLIDPLPGFLFNDALPPPDEIDLRPLRLIELMGPGRLSASNQCLIQ